MRMEVAFKRGLDFFIVILLICIVAGIVISIIYNRDAKISDTIKKNLKHPKQKIISIVLCGVLFFAACTGREILYLRTEPTITINYNYPEASSGLKPNGTKFTATDDILPDEVMNTLMEVCDISGVSPEDLRSVFLITPQNINKEVSLEQPYVATEYKLQYKAEDSIKKGINVDAKKIIDAFPDVYKEYFINTYAKNTSVLDLDFDRLDDADYLDINTILSSMAVNIQVYLSEKESGKSGFVSEETGESFASLNQKISNYIDVVLENYWAFVSQNGVTKDKEQYIQKLNYDNRVLNTDFQKSLSLYQIYLEAVNMYERDMATIVLVPTRDETGEFYMSRTKLGVDDFSGGAEEASVEASSLALEIAQNNHIIQQLLKNTLQNADVEEAESMIASLKAELSELAELSKITLNEYEKESSNNYISITKESMKDTVVSCFESSIKMTGIFIVLFFGFQVLRPTKRVKKERRDGK